jgi:prevent-host-death family protein
MEAIMLEVNAKDARSNFSSLLDKVERGEEIIIKRRGKKIACLVSLGVKDRLPSLNKFRSSVKITGKPLSKVVTDLRNGERY